MRIPLNRHSARRNKTAPAVLELDIIPEDEAGEIVTFELTDVVGPGSVQDEKVSIKHWLTPADYRALMVDLRAFGRVMGLDNEEPEAAEPTKA